MHVENIVTVAGAGWMGSAWLWPSFCI